jgi:D-sedoheptulose 7-phosphate isomerase
MPSALTKRLEASIATMVALRKQVSEIQAVCDVIVERLQNGGTVYTCGNGGSAAEALHLAEELIGKYRSNRPPLRAVCLNADPTALTCIANDFGFDEVFSRQCEALAGERDVLVVFSTSGRSRNVVRAVRAAKKNGAAVVALLGGDGGDCAMEATDKVIVAASDTAHVQEAHQVILHLICEAAEAAFAA